MNDEQPMGHNPLDDEMWRYHTHSVIGDRTEMANDLEAARNGLWRVQYRLDELAASGCGSVDTTTATALINSATQSLIAAAALVHPARALVAEATAYVTPCPIPARYSTGDQTLPEDCAHGAWPCQKTELAWRLAARDPETEARRLKNEAQAQAQHYSTEIPW